MQIWAHRGASGQALENSWAAFRKAQQLGCTALEFDLQRTRDGQFVVFHDARLERCTDATGFLRDYSAAELRQNIRLRNGEVIPTLPEMLDFLRQTGMQALIELKNDAVAEAVWDQVRAALPPEQYLIGSFFHPQLHALKKEHAEARICPIFEGYFWHTASYLRKMQASAAAVGFAATNADLVREIQRAGAHALVWTVNERWQLQEVRKWQVEGVISDVPEHILRCFSP